MKEFCSYDALGLLLRVKQDTTTSRAESKPRRVGTKRKAKQAGITLTNKKQRQQRAQKAKAIKTGKRYAIRGQEAGK